ncbi:hypothetical protein D3C86_848690 [compost metagenome]
MSVRDLADRNDQPTLRWVIEIIGIVNSQIDALSSQPELSRFDRRHSPGVMPMCWLKARLNAATDW